MPSSNLEYSDFDELEKHAEIAMYMARRFVRVFNGFAFLDDGDFFESDIIMELVEFQRDVEKRKMKKNGHH